MAELVFAINCRDQGQGQDAAISRFMGRGVKSQIPNSLNRPFEWAWAVENRCLQKLKLFEKKGKSKKQTFEATLPSSSNNVQQDVPSPLNREEPRHAEFMQHDHDHHAAQY